MFSSHLLRHGDLRIGNRIRAARQDRGLTLRGLAARVGISVAGLSEIETEQCIPDEINHETEVRNRPPQRIQFTSAGDADGFHPHDFWPLADLFIGRHLEPVLGRIFPDVPEDHRLYCHNEEEFLHVIDIFRTPLGERYLFAD